jgi:hypothetical protein
MRITFQVIVSYILIYRGTMNDELRDIEYCSSAISTVPIYKSAIVFIL